MFYVTRYVTTRCYGGPEEGGWYYDWSESPRPIAACQYEDSAFEVCRAANEAERERVRKSGEYDRFSVLGGSDYTYTVESVIGEEASTEHPRYE